MSSTAKWIIGLVLGLVALFVIAVILIVLFFVPVRVETGAGGQNNQGPTDLAALTVLLDHDAEGAAWTGSSAHGWLAGSWPSRGFLKSPE